MQEFPPVDELTFLVGAELTQIVLDPYEVRFHFVDQRYSTSLVCESGFEHFRPDGSMMSYLIKERGCRNLGPITLHHLLFDRVAEVEVSSDRFRLTLAFQSKERLVVLSEPGPYESGHIGLNDHGRDVLMIF